MVLLLLWQRHTPQCAQNKYNRLSSAFYQYFDNSCQSFIVKPNNRKEKFQGFESCWKMSGLGCITLKNGHFPIKYQPLCKNTTGPNYRCAVCILFLLQKFLVLLYFNQRAHRGLCSYNTKKDSLKLHVPCSVSLLHHLTVLHKIFSQICEISKSEPTLHQNVNSTVMWYDKFSQNSLKLSQNHHTNIIGKCNHHGWWSVFYMGFFLFILIIFWHVSSYKHLLKVAITTSLNIWNKNLFKNKIQ